MMMAMILNFRKTSRAFSLVETSIAISIAAFVLTTILGLFPLALSTYRESRFDSAKVQAVDLVQSMLQKTRFQDVPVTMAFPWYLDYDGVRVNQTDAIYRIDATIISQDQYMKVLRIQIKNQNSNSILGSYPLFVSDNGEL